MPNACALQLRANFTNLVETWSESLNNTGNDNCNYRHDTVQGKADEVVRTDKVNTNSISRAE